jgi:hypothetical protein
MYAVSSENALKEIYKAKNEVLSLNAALFQAFRQQNNADAEKIMRKRDKLKQEIRRKYNVILD